MLFIISCTLVYSTGVFMQYDNVVNEMNLGLEKLLCEFESLRKNAMKGYFAPEL